MTFFLPHGRMGRLRFWRAVAIIGIAYLAVWFAAIMIGVGLFKVQSAIGLGAIIGMPLLVAIWAAAMVGAQRLHDRDRSAWWLFLAFVPVGGLIWYLFANGTIPGTGGPNRFGLSTDGRTEQIAAAFDDGTPRAARGGTAGLAGTIVLWLTLIAMMGAMAFLFQNPQERQRIPATSRPPSSP